MFKPVYVAAVFGLLLAADTGCKKKDTETTQPEDVAETRSPRRRRASASPTRTT
jgi:hypothetical protein